MACHPKFSAKQIMNETVSKQWFLLQYEVYKLGHRTKSYIQNYINSHRKRKGGSGKLAKAMELTMRAGIGRGQVFWGIGNINKLNTAVPYWYVINYGKKVTGQPFVPGGGKMVPGSFEGDAPNGNLEGRGTQQFKKGNQYAIKPGIVRPINYISSTYKYLNKEFTLLLAKLKGK